MTFSIILLLLIIVALFEHNSTFYFPNGLITKGKPFKSEEYPYVVFVKLCNTSTNSTSSCTGTLVKDLFVLTAGHCCDGFIAPNIYVCQGPPTVKKPVFHSVVKVYMRQEYSPVKNDICVLKLKKAFRNIKKFSKVGGSINDFADGKKLKCVMIGFGLTADPNKDPYSGFTMTTDVVYGRTACKNPNIPRNKDNWRHYLCNVPEYNESSICQGDSGGPMICNNLQYGVCSFYYPYVGNDTTCGYPYQQAVYMFMVHHIKWLKSITDPKKKKKKRSSGNFLKPYTLHIILSILLCNIFIFI